MSFWQRATQLSEAGTSFVTITITDISGAAPQNKGAKCTVTQAGLNHGTVGGGKVEASALKLAKEMLSSQNDLPPLSVKWNLQKDIQMTCGGEMSFLFEYFPANSWQIVIFGAGHITQALSRVLNKLNCQLTVIDSRQEWIDKLGDCKTTCLKRPQEAVKSFNDHTFFLSITHGHAHDVPILVEIFKNFPNAPYVGVIGSKSKANAIKKDLEKYEVSEGFINKLIIPLGLPFGSNDPEEIAISITAELLQYRDKLNSKEFT